MEKEKRVLRPPWIFTRPYVLNERVEGRGFAHHHYPHLLGSSMGREKVSRRLMLLLLVTSNCGLLLGIKCFIELSCQLY